MSDQSQDIQGPAKAGFCIRGIPFAKAPTGDNRWKPASPVTGYAVKDSSTGNAFSPAPMQYFSDDKEGFFYTPPDDISEDCLYLNLWAPRGLNTDSLR